MLKRLKLTMLMLAALAVAAPGASVAGENMIGGQSQNEGVLVLPKPGPVTVDGKLDDWDWSGRIWVFADKSVRNRFSAEVALMWDSEALYLGAKWKDPTPMHSTVNPAFNPENGWRADSIQLRVQAPDQTAWITTWLYTPEMQPVLHHAVWKDRRNARKGTNTSMFVAEPGSTKLGQGVEMAYKENEAGDGYVQEARIPWDLLYANAPEASPGQTLRIGMEFLWGDPTGNTWPIHRYADNMQPGVTHREFYWASTRSWGDAKLVAENDVPVRQYVSDSGVLEGTIPLRVQLPADAAGFSLAIEDESGRRVRNLGGLDPADYKVEENGDAIVVEVPWDGLNDPHATGDRDNPVGQELVSAGSYRVRGVYHAGLGAEYEMTFYNPGTPPWDTSDGSGAWGADHGAPLRVAQAGDGMVVSWSFAEGGSGIIGINDEGQKIWGEKRGAQVLAADEAHLFAKPASWHIKQEVLVRLDRKTGDYAPFMLDGEPRPFELPTAEILGKDAGEITGMAAGDAGLAVATTGGRVYLIDKDSARVLKQVELAHVGSLAFADDGTLYGLVGGGAGEDHAAAGHKAATLVGGAPHRIDLEAGKAHKIDAPGLGKAVDLSVDREGNLVIADIGPDKQVKAYSPAGQLVYTCGQKGGRPIRGNFQPQAMMAMSSVAVDAQGNVWVVENWNYPRRVSVWGRDGKLVRDYMGNTGYAATGAFLHDTDPTLGYVGPLEFRLNRDERSWQLERILWVPDKAKGERFPISTSSHLTPRRFESSASGQTRQYLFVPPYRSWEPYVVYMEREDGWAPVAAIGAVGNISGRIGHHSVAEEMPTGEWADLNLHDAFFWTDRNGDGIPQRSEARIVPTDKPAKKLGDRGSVAVPIYSGWGGRCDDQLRFYAQGIVEYAPVGFTDAGAPIYSPEGMREIGVDDRADLVPTPDGEQLLALSFDGRPSKGLRGIDPKTGEIQWTYPNLYPGVHGSHRATMPQPGLIIGPLKITGTAHVNDQVGRILHLRGNLGQDYLLTADGLFIDSMFQDGRLPGMSLPTKEQQLVGMPMETFSQGGEPFNGWFGRHSDGVFRLTSGISRQAAMVLRLTGLESIGRLPEQRLNLDAAQIARAQLDNAARAAEDASAQDVSYTIARIEHAKVDGKADEWQGVPGVELQRAGSPQRAQVQLGWDKQNLYAFYDVQDASPWQNEGKDFARLFKTGDTVDLQLGVTGNAGRDPGEGDLRVLVGQLEKQAAAVLMQPVAPGASEAEARSYTSPVMSKRFDRVAIADQVSVKATKVPGGYQVELAVPWQMLGVEPKVGLTMRGDVGFTGSDAEGRTAVSRTYWSNQQTNLVNDEPSEAWLYPERWGTLKLGE